jgi:hypothetical protein
MRQKASVDWRIALGLGDLPKVDAEHENALVETVEQAPREAGHLSRFGPAWI